MEKLQQQQRRTGRRESLRYARLTRLSSQTLAPLGVLRRLLARMFCNNNTAVHTNAYK